VNFAGDIQMSLPRSLGAVVGSTERGKTALHPSVGQDSMGHSSASRLHRKESTSELNCAITKKKWI
jgi:hypothetical protein